MISPIEFVILTIPANQIKATNKVPELYKYHAGKFINPYMVLSPAIDIIYQVKNIGKCTIVGVDFFVHRSSQLLMKVNGSMGIFNLMLSGSPLLKLQNIGDARFLQGQFSSSCGQIPSLELLVEPGIYEMLFLCYDRDLLEFFSTSSSLVRNWLEEASYSKTEYPNIFNGIIPDRVYEEINRLRSMDINNSLSEMWLEFKLLEILLLLISHQPSFNPLKGFSEEVGVFNTIVNFIENNLHRKITLDELSKVFHISVSKIRRYFVNQYGRPFLYYLRQKRLERGRELLLKDRLSIDEISYLIGYQTQAAFSKEFKKHYSCSPSEYKLRQNELLRQEK